MSAITLISLLAGIYFLSVVCRLLYNIYLHPLSKFPGPWWAGATSYAEAYFDIIKGGRYFAEVEAMHGRYGPIVRVTPSELSIRDSGFYEHIYGGVHARRDIDLRSAALSAAPTSVISTVKHDHHRVRRNPLLPFFSKQAITKLEPYIWSRIALLVNKLKLAQKNGAAISTIDAYGALTTDVITHYFYGETFDYLGKDTNLEFKNDFSHAFAKLSFAAPVMTHFPLMTTCLRCLPDRILEVISPNLGCVNYIRRRCGENGAKYLQTATKKHPPRPNTIFEALLSPSMPPEEKTLQRLTDESFLILAAGLETTTRFLTIITCHLLLNPAILDRLRSELKTVMPMPGDRPPCSVLENLPYLSAVINEGLRCETSLASRFPRTIVEPLRYRDFIIPAGTSIGCSPYLQNHSADVFPEPNKFRPERWIEASERGENLTKYLGSFTKGGRMCIGINLAYSELFLVVAAVFRNFDMELVDSGLEDITMKRAFTLGYTENYDFGIKVKITKVLQE